MGGGGSSSTTAHSTNYYTTTGGGIDFTNLLGNLSYKGGDISTTNTQSFTQHLSSSQESTATSKGGSGGTFDVAASVGVGLGGSGSGGSVDKTSSYTGDSDTFGSSTGSGTTSGGISTTTMLIGAGVAVGLAVILARRKK